MKTLSLTYEDNHLKYEGLFQVKDAIYEVISLPCSNEFDWNYSRVVCIIKTYKGKKTGVVLCTYSPNKDKICFVDEENVYVETLVRKFNLTFSEVYIAPYFLKLFEDAKQYLLG